MTVNEKIIKKSNKKIEQNKTQYDLDTQTAKISALSSGNVGKYELLTGKDVLPEKDLLEYSPLGSKLKKQTNIVENNIKD